MIHDLNLLAERVPLVTDRVLLELANGLTVASALTAERQSRGFIARLAAQVTGRDHQAQLMTLRSLIDGQQAITEWLNEVTARGAITDLALAHVTAYLSETSRVVAGTQARGLVLAADIQGVSETLASLSAACAKRLDDLESWRDEVTLYLSAQRAFESATERWQAGRSYAELPWPYQVLLLAREVAGGPGGWWDYTHGPEFSARLTDRIVTRLNGTVGSAGNLLLVALLDEACEQVPDVRQRQFLAEMLDVGLDPGLALPGGPFTTTAALTMELGALPEFARPGQPARMALELARRRTGWLDGGATLTGLVRTAVREQMEMATLTWRRLEARR
jgi:hypothetical protein